MHEDDTIYFGKWEGNYYITAKAYLTDTWPFVYIFWQLTTLSEGDREALGYILKASIVIDDIFYEQVNSFLKYCSRFSSNSCWFVLSNIAGNGSLS
jgi:hypothetical protein